MIELGNLSVERAREAFPDTEIEPIAALYENGAYRCSVYADNMLAYGYGKSMNECLAMLIAGIRESLEVEHKIMYQL
jgi:hypothetical protein